MATSPPPSVPPCPACGKPDARHLDGVSEEATVDLFDCRACQHLWTVNKLDPSKVTHVTPLKDKPPKTHETRKGDVLIRDHAVYFHVWVVTRAGALQPDPNVHPFEVDRRAVAIEQALKWAGASGGRVFSIDRVGVWTEVRRRQQGD